MSILEKITSLKKRLGPLSQEELYHHLILQGKALPPFQDEWRVEENRVRGCQSTLYLHVEEKEGLFIFSATSDALISAGLAALLIEIYSNETAQTILSTPPTFLVELGLFKALSPNRATGLLSLYQHLKTIVQRSLQPCLKSQS